MAGPLAGLRVLEIGHFIAGPFCTRLLADLGADVVKVEPPGGDPVRSWGEQVDGHSLYWSLHGRNKRSVTLNLKHPQGRETALRLVAASDVLVENFKPGQLDRFGLDEAALLTANPDLVIARVSGYGQDGPYRDRAAFGVVAEAIGGIRHLSAHPPEISDLPPVRIGVSFGDMIAGMYAAMGVLASLWEKGRHPGARRGAVDVALTEAVFSLLEGCLPEYGKLGKIRQPTGSSLPTTAPSNAYRCADGRWLLIAANSSPLFAKLMKLIDRADLRDAPDLQDNPGRVARMAEIDAAIGAWTCRFSIDEAERRLAEVDVPATRIYTVADCAADEQFRARGMVREVEDPLLGRMLHPGIVPRFTDDGADSGIRWTGPEVGAHNAEVYAGLGLTADEIAAMQREGAI